MTMLPLMNLKSLALTAALLLGCCSPAVAKTDPDTDKLLTTVRQYVDIYVNPDSCDKDVFAGSYNWSTQVMVLCMNTPRTAYDDDTVRHEVWHVIQSCLTPSTSSLLHTVMPTTDEDWDEVILNNLSARTLTYIQDNYKAAHWDAEIEAFSSAKMFTSAQIHSFFNRACVPSTP